MHERDVFTAALAIADAASRRAYLDAACVGDEALRRRVEILLHAHAGARLFLELPPFPGAGLAGGVTEALQPAGERADADDDEEVPLDFLEPSLQPGSLGRLAHYEVLEVVGRGGFGTVVRAFDERLHRTVAIKVMARGLAATSPPRKRFLREARASAAVRHEHVVNIYAVDEQPIPYLVMEYIAGPTLQAKIDQVGPIEIPEVLRIGIQIAEGLAAAHRQGLIHRDIKPANILLEDAAERVKITDFGLARAADDASLTQSGMIAGTPMYMAPEQAHGAAIDQRADLFSLGSVLYVMCTGRPPFRASSTLAVLKRVAEDTPRPVREIIPEVPEALCALIDRLHAKDPADRFNSAQEVASLLRAQLRAHRSPQRVRPVVAPPRPGAHAKPAPLDSEFAPPRPRTGGKDLGHARPRSPLSPAWVMILAVFAILFFAEITGISDFRGAVARLARPRPDAIAQAPVPPMVPIPPAQPAPGNNHIGLWGFLVDPLGDVRVERDGDRLTLALPARTSRDLNPEHNLNAPRVVQDVEGDWVAQVKVLPSPRPHFEPDAGRDGHTFQMAGLMIWAGDREFVRYGVSNNTDYLDGRPLIEAKVFGDGKQASDETRPAGADDGPTYLQAERRGSSLVLRSSTDGVRWSFHRGYRFGGRMAPVTVGILAVHAGPSAYAPRFEGWSVRPLGPPATTDLGPWGRFEDPTGACQATRSDAGLAIAVPAEVGCDLNPRPGFSLDAPRAFGVVEGDFAAQVHVLPFGVPGAADDTAGVYYRWAGLVVWADENRFVRFGVAEFPDGANKRPLVDLEYFWNPQKWADDLRRGPAPPRHFRAERRGDALTLQTSADGQTWTSYKTVSVAGYPAQLRVGVAAIKAGTKPFTPRFDGWQLGPLGSPAATDLGPWGRLVDPLGGVRATRDGDGDGLTLALPADSPRDLNPTPDPAKNLHAPRLLRPAVGDFTARVKLPPYPRAALDPATTPEGHAYQFAGLVVWASGRDLVRFGVARNIHSGDGGPFLHAELFRNARDFDWDNRDIRQWPAYLEAERRGDELSLRSSPDGVDWTLCKVFDLAGLPAELHVGVAAVNTTVRAFAPRFEGWSLRAAGRPMP